MSLKARLRYAIGIVGEQPWLAPIIQRPAVRRALEKLPGGRMLYPQGWSRLHPFDRRNGTDTSGQGMPQDVAFDKAKPEEAVYYGGSQPSVLREALKSLPPLEACAFIDLGCGKGRPLFVAAEFPFHSLVGVELSAGLAGIARRNARVMARRRPEAPPVHIVTGDATTFPLPDGPFVLFLYNPFGKALIEKIVANIEAALQADRRSIYVIYYNPVFGECFDASKLLSRRFARTLPYAEEDLGYGYDREDPVVIWETGDGRPAPGADARIVVTNPGVRAELQQ